MGRGRGREERRGGGVQNSSLKILFLTFMLFNSLYLAEVCLDLFYLYKVAKFTSSFGVITCFGITPFLTQIL